MPEDKPRDVDLVDRIAEKLLLDAEDEAKAEAAAEPSEEPDTEEHETVQEGRGRPRAGEVETRRFEVAVDGKKVRGVIPYGVESRDMGGWREIIDPGALRSANLDELVARVDHAGVPIGRFPRTLDLEDRTDGLHWAVTPPESRSDVREAIQRGDLRAGSWQMVVGAERWEGDTRHVEQIQELRDVSVVSAPAYPAASVEYRSAPKITEEVSQVEAHNENEESQATDSSEQEETTEERSSKLPNSAGSLRVEDRVDPALGNTSLAGIFESRGFPGETATVSWDEYRAASWGGTVDLLSPSRVDGIPLGADTRWAFPAFASVALGSDVTSVQVFRQDSRTLPAGTAVASQRVGGTATKAEVSTAGSVTTTTLQQVAGISTNIPNAYLETGGFASLVEQDLRLAVNGGLDALVNTGLASCGAVTPSTNLVTSIRNAAGSVQVAGYNPDTVLLPISDAIALDTLVTGIAAGTADFVFAAGNFAPRTLFGMATRTYVGGTATVVCDSRALGKLYASPITLARFEVDAGATNRSNIRLECNAAFPIERVTAAFRIAYS